MAHRVWRSAADQFRTRWPKLGACMDDSEHDVLAFPIQHRAELRSTNPLERLERLKCRADQLRRLQTLHLQYRPDGVARIERLTAELLAHR